nr:NIPSNAP family protein [Luteimonas galliterrae]
MIDSDDVLLLREVRAGSGFGPARPRPPVGAQLPPSREVVTTYRLAAPADAAFLDLFDRALVPAAAAAGARLHAAYATEYGANNFPRLPVREGEHVFVWIAGFDDQASCERYQQALASSPRWRERVLPELSPRLIGPPEVRRLAPAARSLARD